MLCELLKHNTEGKCNCNFNISLSCQIKYSCSTLKYNTSNYTFLVKTHLFTDTRVCASMCVCSLQIPRKKLHNINAFTVLWLKQNTKKGTKSITRALYIYKFICRYAYVTICIYICILSLRWCYDTPILASVPNSHDVRTSWIPLCYV